VDASAARVFASVGTLEPGDRSEATEVLARAFRDNPLNRAVIASADPARRLRSNRYGMRSLLPVAVEHGRVLSVRSERRLVGVLISTPPGGYPLPPPSLGSRVRCLLGQGVRVAHRWSCVFETLAVRRSSEPLWYLGTLGVDPSCQGGGFGSALLAAWLEEVDRDTSPACLETDVRANIAFYARAGFQVEEELSLLGTLVWRMRRPGRVCETPTRTDRQ